MQKYSLVLFLFVATSALADALPVCNDSHPIPQSVDTTMNQITINGELGRKLYSAMTTAPQFSCNSAQSTTSDPQTCAERGTDLFYCQQVSHSALQCADYVCLVQATDIAAGKL